MSRVAGEQGGRLRALVICFALAWGPVAQAFQLVAVGPTPEPVQVLASPDAAGLSVDSLKAGVRLYASDRPTNGFYKVKTPSGKVGWVEASRLVLPAKPAEQSSAKKTALSRPQSPKASTRSRAGESNLGFRAFGTLSLFNLKELNALHEVTELKNGTGFGGQALFRVGTKAWLVVHAEKIGKKVEIEEVSGNTYLLQLSSLPLMVGADFDLARGPKARLGATILAGIAASTKLSTQATLVAEPNETTYSGSPMTFLGRIDGELMFSPKLGVGLHAGYRVLKLASAAPKTAGDTYSDDPLRDAAGEPTAQSVDLSGVILGAGLVLRL